METGRKQREEGRERGRDVKKVQQETAGGCVVHELQTQRVERRRERQQDHHRDDDAKEKTHKQTRTPQTKWKRRGKPGDRG